jgi:hypothetical protein
VHDHFEAPLLELQGVCIEAAAKLSVHDAASALPFQARGEEEAALALKIHMPWVLLTEFALSGVLRVDDQVQRDDQV